MWISRGRLLCNCNNTRRLSLAGQAVFARNISSHIHHHRHHHHRHHIHNPIHSSSNRSTQHSAAAAFREYSSPAAAAVLGAHRGESQHLPSPSAITITTPDILPNLDTMPDNGPTSGPKPTHSKQVTVTEDGQEKEFTAITEGKATILFPGGGEVFYNPIQNFNRDLSVLAIRTFGERYLREREEGRRARKDGKGGKGKGKKEGTEGERGVDKTEEKAEEVEGDAMDVDQPQPQPHGGQGKTTGPATTATATATPPQPSPFRILDALSATGLRALRYAHEIPFATHLTANDLSAAAVKAIHRNLAYNAPLAPEEISKITPTTSPAQAHMYASPHHYHVIDLDPYGTASPFLDSALQSIVTKDSGPGNNGAGGAGGGLLCVTCTDAGVWASTGYAEKCFALYGGMPIKGDASHEAGLRLILYSIATTAAKYGLAIEPLLSLSIDFYARVFVRVKRSPAEVKNLASKSMLVYNCDSGCGAWRTVPLGRAKKEVGKKGGDFVKYSLAPAPDGGVCEFCGFREHIGGPMWGGELHEEGFVRELLEMVERVEEEEGGEEVYTTLPRLRGMVSTALNECTFATTPIPVARPKEEEEQEQERVAGEGASTEDTTATINPDPTTPPTPTISQPSTITTTTTAPPTPPYPPLPLPYFFVLPTRLSKTLHSISPTQASLRGALLSQGYPVGRSHCRPNSIKTTAPWIVLWEVMRQWVERFAPVKEGNLSPKGPGIRVLKGMDGDGSGEWREEVRRKMGVVVFDEELGKDEVRSRGGKQGGKREVRYQMNPTANWGPMKAAKGAPHPLPKKIVVGAGGEESKSTSKSKRKEAEAGCEGGEHGGGEQGGQEEGEGEGEGDGGRREVGGKKIRLD